MNLKHNKLAKGQVNTFFVNVHTSFNIRYSILIRNSKFGFFHSSYVLGGGALCMELLTKQVFK